MPKEQVTPKPTWQTVENKRPTRPDNRRCSHKMEALHTSLMDNTDRCFLLKQFNKSNDLETSVAVYTMVTLLSRTVSDWAKFLLGGGSTDGAPAIHHCGFPGATPGGVLGAAAIAVQVRVGSVCCEERHSRHKCPL